MKFSSSFLAPSLESESESGSVPGVGSPSGRSTFSRPKVDAWKEARGFTGFAGSGEGADLDAVVAVNSVPEPGALSPAHDADGDGLTDEVEVNRYGTDPGNPDTDGDGVEDGIEAARCRDPLSASIDPFFIPEPQIVIAKVEGVATAAGCELVAACDLALASDAASFAAPGVNIGFWCHTPQVLLERTVGRKHAMMMLATGALFPAEHALRIGLVNALHPVGELDAATEALARTIAAKPASVLRAGKRSFQRQSALPLAEAYRFVQGEALANIRHPDAAEGIAAFLEKRPPRW